MRKMIVIVSVALLSFGSLTLAAPSASACDSQQCIVNCVRTVVEDGLQAKCRL